MNIAALTLGIVFLVMGIAFRSKAADQDERAMKNKRLASTLMFVASAAFFVAAGVSILNSGGAR